MRKRIEKYSSPSDAIEFISAANQIQQALIVAWLG
jgi:hypothetical protein